jgi:hypothetical protein
VVPVTCVVRTKPFVCAIRKIVQSTPSPCTIIVQVVGGGLTDDKGHDDKWFHGSRREIRRA